MINCDRYIHTQMTNEAWFGKIRVEREIKRGKIGPCDICRPPLQSIELSLIWKGILEIEAKLKVESTWIYNCHHVFFNWMWICSFFMFASTLRSVSILFFWPIHSGTTINEWRDEPKNRKQNILLQFGPIYLLGP